MKNGKMIKPTRLSNDTKNILSLTTTIAGMKPRENTRNGMNESRNNRGSLIPFFEGGGDVDSVCVITHRKTREQY